MSSGTAAGTERPVVIIGAPRSGTNILRDVLTRAEGVETWPCDEINYIWRHGNRGWPTDEFTAAMATERVRRYIRGAFASLARRSRARTVVEKTCANSLRVGFVERVLPDARYVYIVRDGRDVVASALKRWTAPLDVPYLARKARYVPPADLPFYALGYLRNRLQRLVRPDRRLSVWGPRFTGMEAHRDSGDLGRLCAEQWARCVDLADQQLAAVDSRRVHRIRYEEFVRDPAATMARLGDFLEVAPPAGGWRAHVGDVSVSSVGKGAAELGGDGLESLADVLAPTLARHGYA